MRFGNIWYVLQYFSSRRGLLALGFPLYISFVHLGHVTIIQAWITQKADLQDFAFFALSAQHINCKFICTLYILLNACPVLVYSLLIYFEL